MSAPLPDEDLKGGHGGQGAERSNFTRIMGIGTYVPLVIDPFIIDQQFWLIAKGIKQDPDPLTDLPDDQENPYVPGAYTYFGQFVDHDLTFDTRSTLDSGARIEPDNSVGPSNMRTPRLDLDCLYGLGPEAAPYLYLADGKLATNVVKPFDLPRAETLHDPSDPYSRRAIIGDPRNDENSIVCQLQLAFIQFHNKIIDHFSKSGLSGPKLFNAARREVRFTYQNVVVEDFLRRIIKADVYQAWIEAYKADPAAAFKLYPKGSVRNALPLEFTGAAFRYGHSAVRTGYRLNAGFQRAVFTADNNSALSLVGFGDLPASHEIDWNLFVAATPLPGDLAPNESTGAVSDPGRLQFAYKIDTSLVDPLFDLPSRISGVDPAAQPPQVFFRSLAARNLKRGYNFSLPSGQDLAKRLGVPDDKRPRLLFGDQPKRLTGMGVDGAVAAALEASTPLWLYILAEAQEGLFTKPAPSDEFDRSSSKGTQLGDVGGRILLEVFFGILEEDDESYFNKTEPWSPVVKPGAAALTLWDILKYLGKV